MLLGCRLNPATAQSPAETVRTRRHRQFVDRRESVLQDFRFELKQVSDWCRQRDLPAEADSLSKLADELTNTAARNAVSKVLTAPIDPSLPPVQRQWREKARQIRNDGAHQLYQLARDAQKSSLYSMAFLLVGDVIRLNPDHANARRILDYQEFHDPRFKGTPGYTGEWVSPWEAQQRGGRIPHVLHEKFGWIPRRDVQRYEAGERPGRGGWVSERKDALLRQQIRYGWEIPSEHFEITTNVGLEAGVQVSRQLETFHDWLTENFPGFFETPRALRERFAQAHSRRTRKKRNKPMEVLYFASRDEYQRAVNKMVPAGIETNGLYWQPLRKSYFFRNPSRPGMDTVFHEATHQILDIHTAHDRRIAARALGRRNRRSTEEWVLGGQHSFWLLEGLACYLESFHVNETDGQITVGDPGHVRIVAARHRLLRDNYYVPLEMFCRLGKDAFQNHPERAKLYSQASGVTHFLMHYDNGRYRESLVELLSSIYRPDPKNPTRQLNISEVTGVSFADLDQQYREYMQTL